MQKNTTYVTRIETDYEFLSLNVKEIKSNVINGNYFSRKNGLVTRTFIATKTPDKC